MPTKKAFAPKKVDPKIIRKPSRKIDSTMLRFDSHLMPLPTPDSADRVEAPMMMTMAKMIPAVEGPPSSVISHSPRPIRDMPSTNWFTPKPSVCATPRIVATTATASIRWPQRPDSALPNSGVSEDRIVSGSERRYEK